MRSAEAEVVMFSFLTAFLCSLSLCPMSILYRSEAMVDIIGSIFYVSNPIHICLVSN